jgi:hypothetical protein
VGAVGIVTRTRPKTLGLWECARCLSRYVQPVQWEVLPSGRVAIDLRCPECFTWHSGTFDAERVREMDRMLVRGRSELRAIYGRTVRDNMYRELDSFTQALDLDLIGPDDFLPRLAARYSYQP